MRHPDVIEAAAVGIPHPDLGELALSSSTGRGPVPTEDDLARHMAGKSPYFAVPTRWRVRTDPLPTVGTGRSTKGPGGRIPMRAMVLLAHSGHLDNNGTLHALGLGWTTSPTPTEQHVLIVFVEVEWSETGREFPIRAELVDGDGARAAQTEQSVINARAIRSTRRAHR